MYASILPGPGWITYGSWATRSQPADFMRPTGAQQLLWEVNLQSVPHISTSDLKPDFKKNLYEIFLCCKNLINVLVIIL